MVCGFLFLYSKPCILLYAGLFLQIKKAALLPPILSWVILVIVLKRQIICPAEEQRRPSISSDRPFQRLYRQHIF